MKYLANKIWDKIFQIYWKIEICDACNGIGDEFQVDHEWKSCSCDGGYTKESLPQRAKEWVICKFWPIRSSIRRAFFDARLKVNIIKRRHQEERVAKAIRGGGGRSL